MGRITHLAPPLKPTWAELSTCDPVLPSQHGLNYPSVTPLPSQHGKNYPSGTPSQANMGRITHLCSRPPQPTWAELPICHPILSGQHGKNYPSVTHPPQTTWEELPTSDPFLPCQQGQNYPSVTTPLPSQHVQNYSLVTHPNLAFFFSPLFSSTTKPINWSRYLRTFLAS